MSSAKTLFTAAELEQMPDVDSVQRELDEGELIEMPPAGVRHGQCAIRIMRILDRFIEERKLGTISPSDRVPQLMRKVKQYLDAGTTAVWIVYPATREVHILDRLLTHDDVLEAAELLPGFSVCISKFFS